MFTTLLLGFTAAWFLWSCLSLFRNYQTARKIGLPIVIEPVSNLNMAWAVTNLILQTHPWLAQLRTLLIRRLMRFSYMGWQFDQGYAIHAEIGPAFSLVSPGTLQIIVADAPTAHDILARRKDFIKPEQMYKVFDIFGPNLNSVNGHDWQRHRRLTAPSLNENVSSSVWQQSAQQTKDMLKSWKGSGAAVSTTASDAATVALNVFAACGFGVSAKYAGEKSPTGTAAQLSYRDAVMVILRRYPVLIVLPEKILSLPFMPRGTKRLREACQQFRSHVNTMLNQEKISTSEHSVNLLTNLIRANDAERDNSGNLGLTYEELLGNMFIFTLAGHETTANTVATAVFYLARYLKYQSWIREEVQHVLKSQEGTQLDYAATFPRLKRCLALMLETLRIHGSIVFIPRATANQPQTMKISSSTHIIPPNTLIIIDNHAIQMNPSIWGNDAKEWRPDRWIIDSNEKTSQYESSFESEEIYHPPSGSFIPWAEGPRVCPGKKFSQVEFVAIMAELLRKHEVTPVVEENEKETNDRLDRMLLDSGISSITLQIRHPEEVKLTWKEVEL